jgi:hypothetical protein
MSLGVLDCEVVIAKYSYHRHHTNNFDQREIGEIHELWRHDGATANNVSPSGQRRRATVHYRLECECGAPAGIPKKRTGPPAWTWLLVEPHPRHTTPSRMVASFLRFMVRRISSTRLTVFNGNSAIPRGRSRKGDG